MMWIHFFLDSHLNLNLLNEKLVVFWRDKTRLFTYIIYYHYVDEVKFFLNQKKKKDINVANKFFLMKQKLCELTRYDIVNFTDPKTTRITNINII